MYSRTGLPYVFVFEFSHGQLSIGKLHIGSSMPKMRLLCGTRLIFDQDEVRTGELQSVCPIALMRVV